MKQKLKLEKLAPALSPDLIDWLDTGDMYDTSAEVKRVGWAEEIKTLHEGERAVERYISTRSVDRDREVLDPAGVILDAYKKNPVVLWAHDYSQPPIAKSEWVRRDEFGVKSKTVYAETPRAEEVWQLVKGGFLQTASVGFLPLARIFKGDPTWRDTVQKYNEKWQTDLEKDGAQCITTKWVLLEYSDVPVPANADALITAVAKGLVVSDDLKAAFGDIEWKAEEPEAEPEAPAEEEVKLGRIVRPFTPVAPEPREPGPVEEKSSEPEPPKPLVKLVRAAPSRIICPVRAAPKQSELIAQIAHEAVARLTGRL